MGFFNPLLPTRKLWVTPREFARMHEIIAEHGYADREGAGLHIAREFGLRKYTNWEVIVEQGPEG